MNFQINRSFAIALKLKKLRFSNKNRNKLKISIFFKYQIIKIQLIKLLQMLRFASRCFEKYWIFHKKIEHLIKKNIQNRFRKQYIHTFFSNIQRFILQRILCNTKWEFLKILFFSEFHEKWKTSFHQHIANFDSIIWLTCLNSCEKKSKFFDFEVIWYGLKSSGLMQKIHFWNKKWKRIR